MQSGSLVSSMVLVLKLSLCLCAAKFISGVQSLHGFGTYRFPSETISAISIMPSHYNAKRSSYYGGSSSKSNSQSTLVAIPLYLRGAAQSKPPMLFDILSSSLTETSTKNKKLADIKPKSISSSYEQQQEQQKYGTQHERYQTEKKKLEEYANYASAGYASDEKPVAGVSSQTYNSKPQFNNKITSQKSLDTSQKTDFSDMTPDLDRFGVSKLNDDLSAPFYQSNEGDVNGEKMAHKKRENLSYGSNQNIGSYSGSGFAYDSESNRPSSKMFLNSQSQSHTEVSSSYSPLLSTGNSNSGHFNSAQNNNQNKLLHNNAMNGNSADNIYSSASTIYNPAANTAKNSYTSRYLSPKPYSPYNTQENYNTSPKFNEYYSETNNGEMKDNDNNYDFHTSISVSSQKSNGYTIPASNSAHLDSHEKQTSTGFAKPKDHSLINDGECYDNKAVHASDHSFSSMPYDDQKTIVSKSLQATERPTQTSALTVYDSDEIDPSKLDLKIVHLPISVLKRLVASGELGLPSFQ